MSRSTAGRTAGPAAAEGRWERWALRQAIRAGRRPWTATLLIALALLAQGALAIGLVVLLGSALGHQLGAMVALCWIGGIGGAATLSSSLLGRGATATRAACAWLAFTVVLPICAFTPVILLTGEIQPPTTLTGLAKYMLFLAPVLSPAVFVLIFRAVASRPAGWGGAGLVLALVTLSILGAKYAESLPRPAPQVALIALWTGLAVAPACWWMRAPDRRFVQLPLAAVLVQGVVAVAHIDAPIPWLPVAGMLPLAAGATPFALVARAADSLTVVPPDHPLHDWSAS